MTYTDDGTASRKLLDALGLSLDTPVVEWHTGVTTLLTPETATAFATGGGASSLTMGPYPDVDPSDDFLALGFDTVGGGGRLFTASGLGATWTRLATAATGDAYAGVNVFKGRNPSDPSGNVTMTFPVHSGVAAGVIRLRGVDAGTVQTDTDQGYSGTGNVSLTVAQTSQVVAFVAQRSTGTAVTAPSGWTKEVEHLGDAVTILSRDATATKGSTVSLSIPFTGTHNFLVLVAVPVGGATPDSPATSRFDWFYDEDRTAALVDYSTRHGRGSPLDNVAALTASVTLARALLTDPLPETGERFRLTLNADVATALGVADDERPRFTGEITDVDVDAEEQLSQVRVTGVGRSSRLGRVPVTGRRPVELDGDRVRRALYKAAIFLPLDLGVFDPGTVALLPADWNDGGHNARSVVDQVTQDSLGQLVEHRSGRLDWHDAEHRRDLASDVTLTGSTHIIKPFRWSQAVATVVNIAEVTYGDAEDAEGRATVKVTDPRSADVATGVGPYGVQIDSELADRSDAYSLASTIVGRYAEPAWMLPELAVDIVRTAGAQAGAVLALSHGDKITASGLPPDGPFTAGDLFVEGTTESFTRTAWRMSLAVADPAIAGVGVRWVDLDLAVDETWAGTDPALTWLDAATAAPEDF